MFLLARQCFAKGVRLDERTIAILCGLKASGGLTAEAVAEALNAARPVEGWSETEARRRLDALSKVALADGTVVALAQQDSSGVWYASGV